MVSTGWSRPPRVGTSCRRTDNGFRRRSTTQRASFAELSSLIWQIGPEPWREEHEHAVRRLVAEGVPEEIARRHAFQGELVHGPDIIAVAHATNWEVLEVARAFFVLGERVGLDWLEHRLETLPVGTQWQRWAAQSMEDDLFLVRRQLARRSIAEASGMPVDEAIESVLRTSGRGRGPPRAIHQEPGGRRRDRPGPIHGGAPAGPHASRVSRISFQPRSFQSKACKVTQ